MPLDDHQDAAAGVPSAEAVLAALRSTIETISPETDVTALQPDQPLRRQIDLDSMDWLNLFAGLQERLHVGIPEPDVSGLTTIDAIVAYLCSPPTPAAGGPPRAPAVAPSAPTAPTDLPTTTHVINGTVVTVRPMTAADGALEAEFVRGLSADARYKRFMTTVAELPKSKLSYLTDVDQVRHVALVATVERNGQPDPVAVVRYVVDPVGTSCEFAIALDNDFQRTGLAGILMRMLIDIARARGLQTMEGLVLATNAPMLKFTRQLGFSQQHDPDDYRSVKLTCTL